MNLIAIAAIILAGSMLLTTIAEADDPPDPARVRKVAAMLPATPTGLGQPITDRDAWDALAATDGIQSVIRRAEGALDEPIADQPDDLYLDFSRTGNRTRWQNVASKRRPRVRTFTLAECAENQGRFLAALEETIAALCAEPTWVMPAHDRSLANFNGETVDIDLASAALGWELATVDWLLGDRLSADTRALIDENLRTRILDPYRDMFTGVRAPNWWTRTTNNWNAVCLAGVTGTGLARLASPEERAEFVVAAERYSLNFLAGFTPDGYCSEGLGYWNYGFGHYVLLAETVRQATDGGVDMLLRPEVRAPAMFGANIQIIGGVAPAFADCAVNARPDTPTMYFVNRVLGLGLAGYDYLEPGRVTGNLFSAMIFSFPNAASATDPVAADDAGPALRSSFSDAGILISRPASSTDCVMGVALKAGHNAEHHNHNDVGSYVVVVGSRPVLLDPGSETYTARTFSAQRYESKLLNSFGHPVPVVAGTLQHTGRDARGEVLVSDFTDQADTLTLDLRAAYDVPELQMLERTFVYSRENAGSLTVTDRVRLDSLQDFGTAFLLQGQWQLEEDGAITVYDLDQAVRITMEATGGEIAIADELIEEDARVHPTRVGISFVQPVQEASISLTITPLDPTEIGGDWGLIRNGGFEMGAWGWSLPANCLGEISTELATTGEASLKITDHETNRGSNISSARMTVDGEGSYVLSGSVRHVSGSGIGMYVKVYDAGGKLLNPTDERGWLDAIATLEGEPGEWTAFELPFSTYPGATTMALWIHSMNAADVEAYLDDLRVTPTTDE